MIDIVNAYKKHDGNVLVKCEMAEKLIDIDYAINGIQDKVVFRFVSDFEPKIDGGTVRIEEMQIFCSMTIRPKIKKIQFEGHKKTDILYTVDYEIAGKESVDIKFNFKF